MTKYNKLPGTLEKEPIENWHKEEGLFLFYLDAYWGNQSKNVQVVHVLKREVDDAIDAPKESFLPQSIRISTERMLKSAPTEKAKKDILDGINKNLRKYKQMKVDDILDIIKEYLSEEAFISYKTDVDKRILNAHK